MPLQAVTALSAAKTRCAADVLHQLMNSSIMQLNRAGKVTITCQQALYCTAMAAAHTREHL